MASKLSYRYFEPLWGSRAVNRRAWECLERCRTRLGLDEIPLPVPVEAWIERPIHVCGPGAFTVLKALAFHNRGKPKDAYDLFYVIRNHAAGIEQIAAKIRRFGERPEIQQATRILKRDFMRVDSIGPVRVAEFLGAPDVNLQADVAGEIRALLDNLPG